VNEYLYCGVSLASLALVFYSLFFWRARKVRGYSRSDFALQAIGLGFDIAGTVFMIIGSRNMLLTVHGAIGYSALLAMLAETIVVWRNCRSGSERTGGAKLYASLSYLWWIIAYLAGGYIAMRGIKG
jgi:hypothetical protein